MNEDILTGGRVVLREAQSLLTDRDVTLHDICSDLHMSWNGSADPLDEKIEKIYVWILKKRLEFWYPSDSAYDEAVRQLIKVTLAEEPDK